LNVTKYQEKSMKSLIQKLVEAVGPSGYEDQVREIIRAEITPLADEVRVDAMGNLIARKGKITGDGKRIMLSAHMDEIGVIATHVDEQGFVRFTGIGGVYLGYLPGGRVRFLKGTRGVIGSEKVDAPHANIPMDKLFIDVGASSKADCPVKVGDMAVFDRPFTDLGSRLTSKAMDDRIAVAVLIEALRAVKKTIHEIYFVFSTQEEVGLRGATTAAYGIDPEIGISVDVTLAGDTPRGITMDVALGKGPAIKVRDGGMLADPRLIRLMVDTAEKAKLPYQLEVLEAGTTDARAIQLTRAGVPSGCVSIPCRYVLSTSEMVDYADVQNAVKLVVELVSHPVDLK
jgi:endoglucanase